MAQFEQGMTVSEQGTKGAIFNFLAENGYMTYASLFFHSNLQVMPPELRIDPETGEPEDWTAFMVPNTNIIVVNRLFLTTKENSMQLICAIIRHEIMHSWLMHETKLLKHLAKKHNLGEDIERLTNDERKILENELYATELFNYAADLDISNQTYDELDKELLREIKVGAYVGSGLITEDWDRWKAWTEDDIGTMYDKLLALQPLTVDGHYDPDTKEFRAIEVRDGKKVGVIYGRKK